MHLIDPVLHARLREAAAHDETKSYREAVRLAPELLPFISTGSGSLGSTFVGTLRSCLGIRRIHPRLCGNRTCVVSPWSAALSIILTSLRFALSGLQTQSLAALAVARDD